MTLPNFILIGVAKAGTTSFYRYLDQHPQIYMCPIKGTNYFGYEDALDWKWNEEGEAPALQHFHATTLKEYEASFPGVTDEVVIGEVSPQYFRCPTAASRIHERIPDVKLAVSLRNPADRSFSGFLMRTRRGDAVNGFREELTIESSHVKEGFYYRRLKRYFDMFPRDQIKVYIFEEFKKDPAKTVLDLFGFLGVDSGFVPNTSVKYNAGAVPKIRVLNQLFYNPVLIGLTKSILPEKLVLMAKRTRDLNLKKSPKLPPEQRADLLDLYHEDICRLEELLGRDLSIWRKKPGPISGK